MPVPEGWSSYALVITRDPSSLSYPSLSFHSCMTQVSSWIQQQHTILNTFIYQHQSSPTKRGKK